MTRPVRLLAAASLALTLSGCALLFPDLYEPDWKFGDPPPTRPRTAFWIEGMVTDRFLRPVAGAEIELTTSRPGYVVRATAGVDGRFQIAFSALYEEGDAITALFLPGAEDDTHVAWMEVRARAGDRCSFPVRRDTAEFGSPERVVLELGPCAPTAGR